MINTGLMNWQSWAFLLSIVLVAVFGALILGERLSATNWLGVGLCTAGIVLVALR